MAGRKRARDTQAAAEERAMKRIDRAVKRYGPSAVAKYYSPSPRTGFRPEAKYFDTMFDAAVPTSDDWTNDYVAMTSYMASDGSTVTAYTDAALIPSAIGNGYGQVIGNKYLIKKMKVRGTISVPGPTAPLNSSIVRVLLVQDTQPNGAQASPSLFFTDWGTQRQLLNSFQSIASGSGGRFRILGDRFIAVNPTDSTAADAASYEKKQFSFSKTWKKGLKVVVKSGSATPTVASLSDCNIFLVAHAFSNVAGDNSAPQISGCARCVYMD